MYVKFKGSETTYECTEPIEQKVFRSGVAVGWAIMFHIYGDVDSSKVDEIITPKTISELTFTNDDEQYTTFTVDGYTTVTACTIRHKATTTVTELQFTKANETKTEEGVTDNGNVQE